MAGAAGFGQPGDAEPCVGAQFERVAKHVIDAPDDDIDAAQSFQCFEVDPAVADGEVGALDQREPKLAGFEGVFEYEGLVIRVFASSSTGTRKISKHRIFVQCPNCPKFKLIPFGRLGQHNSIHK